MAPTAESASNTQSLRSSEFSDENLDSPRFVLNNRNLSSSSSPEIAVETVQIPDNGNHATREKKPAWNKLSNGGLEVGPVMGAVSWPALSDSKKASCDSLKNLSDGSVSIPVSQVVASSIKELVTSYVNPDPTINHVSSPTSLKSMNRGGGGVGLANGYLTTPRAAPPPLPMVETPQNNSQRASPHKGKNWDNGPRGRFISQPHIRNDHPQQRNSFRRGNGGPHHGGRHNYQWNPHRSFNGRDVHMQRPMPPPIPPFGNPVRFPDMNMISPVYYVPVPPPPPPESIGGVPYVHPSPFAMFLPTPDPQLRTALVKQIDFYFSYENLCKDTFLRKNMDEQGWVPISLIAIFPRVRMLTDNIQIIFDAVRTSTVIEVQGDKIRKRNDWMTWPLRVPNQSSALDSQSPGLCNYDTLANSVESIGLEKGNNSTSQTDIHNEAGLSRSSSGDLNGQSQSPMEKDRPSYS